MEWFDDLMERREQFSHIRYLPDDCPNCYCNSSQRLEVLGDPTVGVSLSPDTDRAALSQIEGDP